MREKTDFDSISDDELLRRLCELLRHSGHNEVDLIAHIGEVDARRLYAREASPSMFAWCTGVLHLSEHEAFLRITVARASRKHPMLLTMLRDGRLHLSGIAKLAPHLTPDNREALLKRATHKTKRQIEELLLMAEHDYGKEFMARYRRDGGRVSEAPAVYSLGSRAARSLPGLSP